MARPKDPTLCDDYAELVALPAGSWLDVKVARFGERRNIRIHGALGEVDDMGFTLLMPTGPFKVTRRNFRNFRRREVQVREGDFVVRPDTPGWRGVVHELNPPWAICVVGPDGTDYEEVAISDLAAPEEVPAPLYGTKKFPSGDAQATY